jgi:uncharacterized repeat protein (TIGR02543 family)
LKYGQELSHVLSGVTVSVWRESGWAWSEEAQEEVYLEEGYHELSLDEAFPGYDFAGWSGNVGTMPAKDLTLTAMWTPISVTVKLLPGYDYAGGREVSGDVITITARYGDTVSLSSYGFSSEGSVQIGWNFRDWITAGAEIVDELVLVDDYYNYNGGYSVSSGIDDMPAGEVHLVTAWTREIYACTITFDANGGSGYMSDQLVATDGQWTALKNNQFVREGYRFVGWSTDRDNSEGYLIRERDMPTWDTSSVTLYAQWEKN